MIKNQKVMDSYLTLVRVFLSPCVGSLPLLELTLRRDKLGISKHLLPLKLITLTCQEFKESGKKKINGHLLY